jgi:hypothetical protein
MPPAALRAIVLLLLTGCAAAPADREPAAPAALLPLCRLFYVVFPDGGHRRDYGNWRNAIRHDTVVEGFLTDCLGGRRAGSS